MPDGATPCETRLALVPDAVVTRREGQVTIRLQRNTITLDGAMLALAPVVDALERGCCERMIAGALASPASIPLLYFLRARLDAAGMVSRSLECGSVSLGTLLPIAAKPCGPVAVPDAARRFRLSRFAYIRVDGGTMMLESPLSMARFVIGGTRAATALYRLAPSATAADMARSTGCGEAAMLALLALLVGGRFVEPEDTIESEASRLWEFHDLLFHQRSRLGRHTEPYGGMFPFPDVAPLPAIRPAGSSRPIVLPAPEASPIPSATLADVMARRRSIRDHADPDIGIGQLSTFLHRAARHLKTVVTEHGELVERPYPAGGAIHELELHLVVDRCEGLARGIYHYRSADHALEHEGDESAAYHGLLDQASATLGNAGRPQILIVVTARFQRLAWKYRSVSYALILKHVGVLYQTLYLTATDMGLAPCAMGGGDSELFAEATGLDPMVEASVGEFALGRAAGV